MKPCLVDPRLWLETGAKQAARPEAAIAGGGTWVVRESIRTTGVTVGETADGICARFASPPGPPKNPHESLYDSPWRCMLEATTAACGLPTDWRTFARLELELTVLDEPIDLEWSVVGSRSRLSDRRVCPVGRTVLTVDTREIPLIQGREPSWSPVAIRLAARPPANGIPRSVCLHRIALVPGSEPAGPVLDRLGQRRHADWPGKMRDGAELAADLEIETRALASAPVRPVRDRYNGWTGGPRFAPGRFFRVEQDDAGRWWYVDPSGHPYWSFGPTCVRLGDNTAVAGREDLFESVPPRAHPGRWREDGSACFHGTNALTKYGSEEAWAAFTCRRLIAWGATGIGNWSDPSVLRARRLPGTASLTSRVGPAQLARMPDVFDPRWGAAFREHVDTETAPWRGDPWLVGWFVDNEMPWHEPLLLNAPPDAAFRGVWLDLARSRFADPAAFAAATGCQCSTWEDARLLDEKGLGASPVAADLRAAMLDRYARQYFCEVRRILKEADPDHLYLGCRFVRVRPQEGVVRAAGVCDVVTVNAYSMLPERERFDEWHRLCGRPIQIGEHQYAQYGPYLPPPIWHALTAEERRTYFPAFVRTAACMPYCLGSHWFQYVDQAGTGRPSNGENMAIGWIDVVDRPHAEMIDAAREIGDHLYPWHAGLPCAR
jgi:hypothetical protein